MKIKFRHLTWLFATLLCVVACSDIDEISDDLQSQTSAISFTAQMNAPVNKATDTAFDSGDEISVTAYTADGSIYQSNMEYSYSSNSFTTTSPIEYTNATSELEFRALYPCVGMNADKTVTFSVYADQSNGSNYTLSDLMLGYAALTSKESVQLTFDHLLTKVVVNITSSDVDMAEVTVALSAIGKVDYNLSTLASEAMGGVQTITMASNGTNSYKAIIAPQTITSPAPLGVISTTSGDYAFYISTTTTLLGGSQYTINTIIENGEVTIDSTIINDGEDEEVVADERSILEQIYYSTGGDNWTTSTNWCTDDELSEWYGVSIDDETGRVTKLSLSSNNLVGDLDVSGLASLSWLDCISNELTSIDASALTNLTRLDCYYNELTSIDVNGLTNLVYLNCDYNKLTTLDVSGLINLNKLYCCSNSLTTLDVSTLTNLNGLSCIENHLTTLDVSVLTNLTWLYCANNQLTNLDVSALTNLISLTCFSNQLTTLDVSTLTKLIYLNCSFNQLNTLDVSALTKLTSLECNDNSLTSLDVSAQANLTNLSCYDNSLTTLNIGTLTSLVELYCSSNDLTALDISSCSSLSRFGCFDNYLTTIHLYSIPSLFNYTNWGDYNTTLYTYPTYLDGYQYPKVSYVVEP